jgi:hypothetical protein
VGSTWPDRIHSDAAGMPAKSPYRAVSTLTTTSNGVSGLSPGLARRSSVVTERSTRANMSAGLSDVSTVTVSGYSSMSGPTTRRVRFDDR